AGQPPLGSRVDDQHYFPLVVRHRDLLARRSLCAKLVKFICHGSFVWFNKEPRHSRGSWMLKVGMQSSDFASRRACSGIKIVDFIASYQHPDIFFLSEKPRPTWNYLLSLVDKS